MLKCHQSALAEKNNCEHLFDGDMCHYDGICHRHFLEENGEPHIGVRYLCDNNACADFLRGKCVGKENALSCHNRIAPVFSHQDTIEPHKDKKGVKHDEGKLRFDLSATQDGGRKADSGKPRFELIPPEAMTALASVLTYGSKKYTLHSALNWDWGLIEECLNEYILSANALTAITSEVFTRSEDAEAVMKGIYGTRIPSSLKDKERTAGDGEVITLTGLAQRQTRGALTLNLKTGTKEQREEYTCQTNMGLQKLRLQGSLNGRIIDVLYVGTSLTLANVFTLTITTRQGFLEEYYVLGATSISACLKKTLEFLEGRSLISKVSQRLSFSENKEGGVSIEESGDRNWELGIDDSRLFAATQRHEWADHAGELVDSESGLPHLWHAFCNMAMRIALRARNNKCT
jgi:hypothetical protein